MDTLHEGDNDDNNNKALYTYTIRKMRYFVHFFCLHCCVGPIQDTTLRWAEVHK